MSPITTCSHSKYVNNSTGFNAIATARSCGAVYRVTMLKDGLTNTRCRHWPWHWVLNDSRVSTLLKITTKPMTWNNRWLSTWGTSRKPRLPMKEMWQISATGKNRVKTGIPLLLDWILDLDRYYTTSGHYHASITFRNCFTYRSVCSAPNLWLMYVTLSNRSWPHYMFSTPNNSLKHPRSMLKQTKDKNPLMSGRA
jgi:hypothetical protein